MKHHPIHVARLVLCAVILFIPFGPGRAGEDPTSHKRKLAAGTPATRIVPSQEQLDRIATRFAVWLEANEKLQRLPELWVNKALTPSQVICYDALKKKSPDIRIYWDELNGTPIYIGGTNLHQPSMNRTFLPSKERLESGARSMLRSAAALMKISDPEMEFRPVESISDEQGRGHVRFQQTYQGIDVWGKEVYVHLTPSGVVDLVNGRYEPTPASISDLSGTLMPTEALDTALDDLGRTTSIGTFSPLQKEILRYDSPTTRKVIFCDDSSRTPRLSYLVEIRPNMIDWWRYFIDAATGKILLKYNNTCADGPAKASALDLHNVTRTIDTYQFSGTYWLIDASRPMFNAAQSQFPNNTVGAILTINAQNTDLQNLVHFTSPNNSWPDKAAVSAHVNGALTYEYFRTVHKRNSIDGKGSSIWSAVHVTQDGRPMDNAFWNGRMISYGDGDQVTTSWPGALDGAAHEMAHGVTEHSAGLEYLNQSGALNESFSDMFATMVDRRNWTMFEDIVVPGAFPSGAIRDLANPHNGGTKLGDPGWQPAHMNEFLQLDRSQDNGGVHYNSGIPNKAFHLIATTTSKEKAEQIAYCALTTKLTKQSQFIDCRLAFAKCAEELYGTGSAEVQAVKSSFDQVGITDGSGTNKPGDFPMVDGPDFLLFTNTDKTVSVELWVAKPPATDPNDFAGLSQTPVLRRPSVADDGSIAVFVNGAKGINVIALNPMAPLEQILDDTPIWNNVALSRDKKLLAATTDQHDTSIYVFDVATTNIRSKKFRIYTPAYSNTPVPNTAELADAMDFTFDKEYLLYDSFNKVTIGGGIGGSGTFGFWEINVIRVFDKKTNNFGDGTTQRIFPFEPSVSIGNPSLARNKPTVFTFEVQDDLAQTQEILAVETSTGTVKKISDAVYPLWGYPVYKGDDQLISFGSINLDLKKVIINVPVGTDGITATGAGTQYLDDATFPVWFRVGTRPVSVRDAIPAIPTDMQLEQNYPNPFNPSTQVPYVLTRSGHVSLVIFDLMGREIIRLVDGPVTAGRYLSTWNGNNASGLPVPGGMYICRLTSDAGSISKTMMLLR